MSCILRWLLNGVYLTLLIVLAPALGFLAWRKGKYREGYREKLFGLVPRRRGEGYCVWLHAVSVGEVNLLATTIQELQTRHPDWEFVLSSTTRTGYALAQKKHGQHHSVFYCPLDFSWATRRAMRHIRPDLLVLAELELWPNLIMAAKEHGARVTIVNGRLSDGSFRGYMRVGWLARRVLRQVDVLATQDEATAHRFLRLGADPNVVHVTGSLKYDGAETDRMNPRTNHLREFAGLTSPGKDGVTERETVFLAGSTQVPEEAIAVSVFNRLRGKFPHLRLVLVPRHPERFDEVATLLDNSGLSWIRRSQLDPQTCDRQSVILVDSVGELGAWWGIASIGFVGGSFGDRGGQNMIEPAAYGVATSFGPCTRNFRDIVAALVGVQGAVVVDDAESLEAFVRRCLEDPRYAQSLGRRASRFVATQLGATRRTADLLDHRPEVNAHGHAA